MKRANKGLLVEEGEQIQRKWNSTNGASLIQIAIYFANSKTASNVQMTDIDLEGSII